MFEANALAEPDIVKDGAKSKGSKNSIVTESTADSSVSTSGDVKDFKSDNIVSKSSSQSSEPSTRRRSSRIQLKETRGVALSKIKAEKDQQQVLFATYMLYIQVFVLLLYVNCCVQLYFLLLYVISCIQVLDDYGKTIYHFINIGIQTQVIRTSKEN